MLRILYAFLLFVIPYASAQEPEVSVCVRFGVIMDFRTLKLGENTASQIFEPTGVRLRWNCAAPGETQVIVQIKNDTPDTFHRGALAYALPFAHDGVRVVVLYDRLEPYLARRAISGGTILGAVLAHEIGHVLQSVDRHAATGVMRARWTAEDFASMGTRSFGFSAEDADTIRNRVKRSRGMRAAFAR